MTAKTILTGFLGLALLAPGALLASEQGSSDAASAEVSESQDATRQGLRQTQNLPGQGGRGYKLFASSEVRGAAVVDYDPANDLQWNWTFGATAELLPGLSGFGFVPVTQRFSVEEGESPFLLQDIRLGMTYFKSFSMEDPAVDQVYTRQSLTVYTPTSRASAAQDLRFAVQLSSRESLQILEDFTLGGTFLGRYCNHAFAEQAGLSGGMNTKYLARAGGFMDYTLEAGEWLPGYFSLGAGVDSTWYGKYESASDFESAASSTRYWKQSYGWHTYLDYTPWQELTVSLGYEHGGSVLKNGIPFYGNMGTFLGRIVDRDRTEFFMNLTARY